MDDIETRVQALLDDDTAIEAYCQDQWTKTPFVYLGQDPNSLPPKENMPCFMIYGADDEYEGDRCKDFVKIGILVDNDAKVVAGTKVTHTGYVQAKQLLCLAKKALCKSKLGKVSITESGTLRSDVNPVWFSYLTVCVENIEPYFYQ